VEASARSWELVNPWEVLALGDTFGATVEDSLEVGHLEVRL